MSKNKKLKLFGFNNLTKSLSFNIYDVCYASTPRHQEEYLEYIDQAYNSERLTHILTDVSGIIGATILNVAKQDYEPRGASVTMLIAEEAVVDEQDAAIPEAIVAHLDESHATVHTYPERHPDNGISTFRADIDVSTCGRVSPLKALNYLIASFESDIVIIDYRVRGFTRDVRGKKHYLDHKIDSIQDFIARENHQRYQIVDVNVYQENLYHTKMILRDFDLEDYLFGEGKEDFAPKELTAIERRLKREMAEIFSGRNLQNFRG